MLNRLQQFIPTSLFSLRSGIYGVLDQGLYALGNFGVNIALARFLEPMQYGVFAVAQVIFLFFAAFHSAVLTEPMMVFGSGKHAGTLRAYVKTLLYGHWILGSFMALIVGAIGLTLIYLESPDLGYTMLTLAICLPGMLLIWLVRRVFYIVQWTRMAFWGSAFHTLFLALAILFCVQANLLSVSATFVVIGLGSVCTSSGLLLVLYYHLKDEGYAETTRTILYDHWTFGSWNSLAAAVFWISGGMVTIIAAGFLGLAASATIAVVLNLFRPLNLLMQGTALLILPGMSALIHKNTPAKIMARNSSQIVALSVGGTFLYGLMVSVFSDSLFHFFYAGKYDAIEGYRGLIILVGVSYTASAFVQICTSELKASANIRAIISVWSVSAIFVLCTIYPAMILWEIHGAMAVVLISYILAAILAKKMVLAIRDTSPQKNENLFSSMPTRS